MQDHPSKIKWDSENVVRVTVRINRNQNPDLFQVLKSTGNPSALARTLMQQAIERN